MFCLTWFYLYKLMNMENKIRTYRSDSGEQLMIFVDLYPVF